MKCAKFTGPKGLVVIGNRRLETGDIVGEPGGGAPVIGCTGVVEYLLKRADFDAVGEDIEVNQDCCIVEHDAVADELDAEED